MSAPSPVDSRTRIAAALLACAAAAGCAGVAGPAPAAATAALATAPWVADLGDGRYRNPVLHADYSDPDAIRVGDRFYMTASSFSNAPGLPLLESPDLVNWTLVGHALPRLVPAAMFERPQYGNGVWAPCLRWHVPSCCSNGSRLRNGRSSQRESAPI